MNEWSVGLGLGFVSGLKCMRSAYGCVCVWRGATCARVFVCVCVSVCVPYGCEEVLIVGGAPWWED